jgi:hypothetical protein
MSNPCYDLYCHKPNNGELLSQFLLYELEHITKKDWLCMTMISVTQPGCMNGRYSETQQSVTKKIDIRGLHSAEGPSYLDYSQLNSALFDISN